MAKIICFFSAFFITFSIYTLPAHAYTLVHCKIRSNHVDSGRVCQYVLTVIKDFMGSESPLQSKSDMEICQFKIADSVSYGDDSFSDFSNMIITPEVEYSDDFSGSTYHELNTWCKNPEGCDASPNYLVQVGNSLINYLPQSPANVRIPNIISNMVGQGTIGANLAIELYSAVWQYLAIIVFVKFYKLIPGKST